MSWTTIAFSPRGRLNRQPFWLVTIFTVLINIASSILELLFSDGAKLANLPGIANAIRALFSLLDVVIALVIIYVSIVISIKRYHDRDKSGYWILLSLIPIIGTLWVFIETGFLTGTSGPNRFGQDPLAPHDAIAGVFDAPESPKTRS